MWFVSNHGLMAVAASESTKSVLSAIGDTPLIEIDGIWAKLEFLNPSGSVKARLADYVVRRAEAEGLLQPGDTIVEASSGNTGNALSMVAAVKGYPMLVLLPRGVSQERAAISRAFGAEVVEVGDFHVNAALEAAAELGSKRGFFAPQQFESEWNVEENRDWLGAEIVRDLAGATPDALVCGVGTGGTLIGVGIALRAANRALKLIAVEPAESRTIAEGVVGRHLLEGISDGFVPGIYARYAHMVDEVVAVDSAESIIEMRRLAREHGIFVGPSSGAHMLAARRCRAEMGLQNVVTVLSDEGEKYLASHFASSPS